MAARKKAPRRKRSEGRAAVETMHQVFKRQEKAIESLQLQVGDLDRMVSELQRDADLRRRAFTQMDEKVEEFVKLNVRSDTERVLVMALARILGAGGQG